MRPVRIEFVAEDSVAAARLHAAWPRRLLWKGMGSGVVFALMAFLTQGWYSLFGKGMLALCLLCLAVYAFLWLFHLPRTARRLFAQHKALHEPYEVDWNEEGLVVHGARSQGLMPWGDYLKRKQDDELVLLYQSDSLFQMLPKRYFTADDWASLQPHLDRISLAP